MPKTYQTSPPASYRRWARYAPRGCCPKHEPRGIQANQNYLAMNYEEAETKWSVNISIGKKRSGLSKRKESSQKMGNWFVKTIALIIGLLKLYHSIAPSWPSIIAWIQAIGF